MKISEILKYNLIGMMCSFSLFGAQIEIDLEIAKTKEELAFGLMQRSSMPENHGMLFVYPQKNILEIWMFNCLIDLSLAFLDENYYICEIHELKAYPEKLDQRHPIKTYADLVNYSGNFSLLKFFLDRKVTSSFKATYALEMNAGWFTDHHVLVGDQLVIDSNSKAYILQKANK